MLWTICLIFTTYFLSILGQDSSSFLVDYQRSSTSSSPSSSKTGTLREGRNHHPADDGHHTRTSTRRKKTIADSKELATVLREDDLVVEAFCSRADRRRQSPTPPRPPQRHHHHGDNNNQQVILDLYLNQNNDELLEKSYYLTIVNQNYEEICSGYLQTSSPSSFSIPHNDIKGEEEERKKLTCQLDASILHAGDNLLHIFVLDEARNKTLLHLASHLFYTMDDDLWLSTTNPWRKRLFNKKVLTLVTLLTLGRWGWMKYHAPIEVKGKPYDSPKLPPSSSSPPSPGLPSTRRPALPFFPQEIIPPTSTMSSQLVKKHNFVQTPLRWLAYGALLGAAALFGSLPSSLSEPLPTCPLPDFPSPSPTVSPLAIAGIDNAALMRMVIEKEKAPSPPQQSFFQALLSCLRQVLSCVIRRPFKQVPQQQKQLPPPSSPREDFPSSLS